MGSIICLLSRAKFTLTRWTYYPEAREYIHTSYFAVITIRLFPAYLIACIAPLTNRSRSLDTSIPHAAKIRECRSSDVLQEDALKPSADRTAGIKQIHRGGPVNLTSRYTIVNRSPAREFTRLHHYRSPSLSFEYEFVMRCFCRLVRSLVRSLAQSGSRFDVQYRQSGNCFPDRWAARHVPLIVAPDMASCMDADRGGSAGKSNKVPHRV